MTERIDFVLCNKQEETSTELSPEKPGSSMNLYVVNAGDIFLAGCTQPKSRNLRNKHHFLNYQL